MLTVISGTICGVSKKNHPTVIWSELITVHMCSKWARQYPAAECRATTIRCRYQIITENYRSCDSALQRPLGNWSPVFWRELTSTRLVVFSLFPAGSLYFGSARRQLFTFQLELFSGINVSADAVSRVHLTGGRETVKRLLRKMSEFILLDPWPPNSPRIKPVDYQIWATIHFYSDHGRKQQTMNEQKMNGMCLPRQTSIALMNWNIGWFTSVAIATRTLSTAINQQ